MTNAAPNAIELIERKRDGQTLTSDEIVQLINAYSADEVPDYQMAAMLMAIYLNGLDHDELAAWTEAMLHSGEIIQFHGITKPLIDKHSTGGVGDKVSIALVPIVAACGIAVPMISGRGLGHTGGTLDKLEAIPGFNTQLSSAEFMRLVETNGAAMGGQTAKLVPADRKLYALRDVTGTVPSIPLIASSIMSKKLAEGADGLVLDVKVGKGAFMQDLDSARLLAETMVEIGKRHRTDTIALLTAMDQPLGRAVGNSNETAECIDLVHGNGPEDLAEVTFRLATEMILLGRSAETAESAREMAIDAVANGMAAAKMKEIIESQGGDPAVVDDTSRLPDPPEEHHLAAPTAGYVVECHARRIGEAAVRLGAGRLRKEDEIDPSVGIWVLAKEGDAVEEGQPLARIGWSEPAKRDAALDQLHRAWTIGPSPPPTRQLIIDEVR